MAELYPLLNFSFYHTFTVVFMLKGHVLSDLHSEQDSLKLQCMFREKFVRFYFIHRNILSSKSLQTEQKKLLKRNEYLPRISD